MKRITDFFRKQFSKFKSMENKGVAVLFGIQLALCLTAAIVAIAVAASVPRGTPPEGADTSLPDSLPYCYVSFDTDGGSSIARQRVWRGDVPIEPNVPTKKDYTFSGWTKDGEPYDFTEGISADVTLKASWNEMLKCVFEYDDGSESVVVSCHPGDTIKAPKKAPVRDGAYFVGWSVGETVWNFDSAVTESMTLTPCYSTTAEIILSLGFSAFIESDVTLDKEYSAGSLKPVYATLSEKFDVVFKDHSEGSDEAELILGDVYELIEMGGDEKGALLDFRDYLDKMPNLSQYLENNPALYLSLFASSRDKSLYAIPVPELYRVPAALPLFNGEIIKTLLDGDAPFVSKDTATLSNVKCMPSISLSTKISVPIIHNGEITYFTKPSDKYGNVLALMNDKFGIETINGEMAVSMLRDYIDAMYGDVLENRSDLFLGDGAMYDSDELVALLRCVMLNRETLGLGALGAPLTVSSYDELLMLTEMMFGVRGLSADSAHLYFDGDGTLIDARMNENSYNAVKQMRALIAEGLVKVTSETSAYEDAVMTLYLTEGGVAGNNGFSLALPPFAYYPDFDEAMRYLPSIDMYSERAFSAIGAVKDDSVKLNAIIKMIDYMYSEEGMALINLGGGAFCDGSLASDLAKGLLGTLSDGDYGAFLQEYLGALSGEGSYISFGDDHAEMLFTIDKYLSLGVIKASNTLFEDDYLYSYVPNRIYLTGYNEQVLSELTEITSEEGMFSFKNESNVFVQLLSGERNDYDGLWDVFWAEMGGREYLTILRRAMGSLKTYYHAYLYS